MRTSALSWLNAIGLTAAILACSCSDGELPTIEDKPDGDTKTQEGGTGGDPGVGGVGGGGGDAGGAVGGTGGSGGEPPVECKSTETLCGSACCDNATQNCESATKSCVTKPSAECDEVGTACGEGLVCNGEKACVAGCMIDGLFYDHGAPNPGKECEACLDENPTGWTDAVGLVCGDGMVCDGDLICQEGCFIDGSFYEYDDDDAGNICRFCSSAHPNEWTIALGETCDGDLVCDTSGECVSGCVIDGTSYAPGQMHPTDLCRACDVENSSSEWTVTAGESCGTGGVCVAGGDCISGCVIGTTTYDLGAKNPDNHCESCQASNPGGWTGTGEAGSVCNDGKVCNADHECVGGCVIDGVEFTHGDARFGAACEYCDEEHPSNWSTRADGWKCDDGQVCRSTEGCVSGCSIGGDFFTHGTDKPGDPCHFCAADNENEWTPKGNGAVCDGAGTVCDGTDTCRSGCMIDGSFVPLNSLSTDGCNKCTEASATSWTLIESGAGCGEGSVCDGVGHCVSGCVIGGETYGPNAQMAPGSCRICGVDSTDWSDAPVGFDCDDGKICNAAGECVADCFIAGVGYVPADEKNPANMCETCTPPSTHGWTSTFSQGENCGEGKVCQSDYTCDFGCHIPGTGFVESGEQKADELCKVCESPTTDDWTVKAGGWACDDDSVCDQFGECKRGCFILGQHYPPGPNPLNPCQKCDPSKPLGWTDLEYGDACGTARGWFAM
ncbi:MAG: hypothetical protein FWD57_05805 [Polyangiaceae bacterium]|nr:hypothetical protein [Polyangiaceae bacterium]